MATAIRAASASVSYCNCDSVEPLSMMARAMRMKWVNGRNSPMACAQRGMPRNGKMKPDSSMLGRKNIIDICTACSWFCASVENV